MTYSTWTEKHRNIALERHLTPSARELYEYLVLEGFEGKPQILDLREFNKFIAKRRGQAYDRRTIKAARIFLEDCGLLTACKKFTAFVHHVTLRAVSALFMPKKHTDIGCKSRSLIATLEPSNELTASDEDYTTTTILSNIPETEASYLEQNLQQCEDAGIEFTDPHQAVKVLANTHPEEVMAACDYYLDYIKRNKVDNPAGFLRRCLQRRWWEKGQKKVSFFDALVTLCIEMGRIDRG